MAQSKKQKLETAVKEVLKYFKVDDLEDLSMYDCSLACGSRLFPLVHTDVKSFGYCCGAVEIGNFHLLDGDNSSLLRSITKAANYVFFNHPHFAADDEEYANIIIATTIPEQIRTIAILKHVGFMAKTRQRNNNSGEVVTVWVKTLPYKG